MKTSRLTVRRLLDDTEQLVARADAAEESLRALQARVRRRRWFLETVCPDRLVAEDRARLTRLLRGSAQAAPFIAEVIKSQRGSFTSASIAREVRRKNPAVARRMRPNAVALVLLQQERLGVLKCLSTQGRTRTYVLTR